MGRGTNGRSAADERGTDAHAAVGDSWLLAAWWLRHLCILPLGTGAKSHHNIGSVFNPSRNLNLFPAIHALSINNALSIRWNPLPYMLYKGKRVKNVARRDVGNCRSKYRMRPKWKQTVRSLEHCDLNNKTRVRRSWLTSHPYTRLFISLSFYHRAHCSTSLVSYIYTHCIILEAGYILIN